MYCQKCGKEIPNDSNLCPYCGASLKNQTENKPPKKKKGCLFGCLGFIIIIILFGVIASCSNNSSNNTSTTSQVQEQKYNLKMNDSFKSNAFELTVTGKDTTKRVTDQSGYLYTDADGVFVIVHLHYKNIANEPKMLDSSAFTLVSDGKEYKPTIVPVRANSNIFLDQINPGIEKDGEIYFDVPSDVANSNLTLRLDHSFISDNFSGIVELY